MVGLYWGLAFGYIEFFATLIVFRLWIYGMVIRAGDIMQYTLKVVKQESGQEQIRYLMQIHGFLPAKNVLDLYGILCDFGVGTFTVFFESAYLATQAYDRTGVAYQLFKDVGTGIYYRDGKMVVLSAEEARLKETLGDKAYLAGNYDEAESNYKDAIAKNQTSSSAWRKLGLTYYKKGEWSKAISALLKAIGLDDDEIEARLTGAWCYIKLDELDSALELLYDLYYKQGASDVVCSLMARIYCVFGNYAKGITFADYALTENSNSVDSLIAKAFCKAKQGDNNTALVIISKVLTLDSTNSLALEYRQEIQKAGTIYAYYVMPETGEKWNGIYEYDKVAMTLLHSLNIENDDYDSIITLISVYIKQDSLYNALTMCEYVLAHKGKIYSITLKKIGILLVFKLYSSALTEIGTALTTWNNDTNLLVCKAFANAKLGYIPTAYNILLEVLSVDSTNKLALLYKNQLDSSGVISAKYTVSS